MLLFQKRENKKPSLLQKKKNKNIVCFFASQTIADHNVNLAYVHILKLPEEKEKISSKFHNNPF